MTGRRFQRSFSILALLAASLLVLMPTTGRLLVGAADCAQETVSSAHHMAHADAGHVMPHMPAHADMAADEDHTPASGHDFCPYCPLLASLVTVALLWLLSLFQRAVRSAPYACASAFLPFRLAHGLGARGPPTAWKTC